MAKSYRKTLPILLWNRVATLLIRLGVGAPGWRLLTVRGRRTGRSYTTPVSLVTHEGREWLVSPYGRGGWAANALALGEVSLRRGGRAQRFRVREVEPQRAAPVLRAYLAQESFTRPYFDVTVASSDAELASEARAHPVFELEPA
jgi:deazaflavin-dependent oxidoreductase (nitroreductase family)